MPELKLKQIHHEVETWKRLLCFISEENIHLKNRLSEILKYEFDTRLLKEIEIFQTRFIKEDELVTYLRNALDEIDKLAIKEVFEDKIPVDEIEIKLNNLRSNISKAENDFSKLKEEFNIYLLDNTKISEK